MPPQEPASFDSTGCGGLLMAGGRSLRMGQDKAWLMVGEQPLWQVQHAKLASLNLTPLYVACRREQDIEGENIVCLYDPPGDDRGPLPVIAEALRVAASPLLVLAVDMIGMTAAFMRDQWLGEAPSGLGLFYEQQGRYEPLAGLYVPAMLPLFEAALAEQKLGLQRVIAQSVDAGIAIARSVAPADQPFFANANTPEEWRLTTKKAGG